LQIHSITQRILRSIGIYSIAVVAGRMSGFLLLPVYTRYLTPTDYGVLELLELTSFIFSTVIGMRFAESLFYYYAEATTQDTRAETVSTAFFGSLLLGCLGGAFGWLASPALSLLVFGSDQYVFYFRLVFLNLAFSLLQEVGFCYMRVLDRPGAYVIASIGRLIISIVLNVTLLVFVGMGAAGVLWSSAIASVAIAICLAIYSLRGISLSFNYRLAFSLFRYAVPLGVSGLALFIVHFGDRFFLRRWVSLADIGIYALAYKIGMLISYVHMPFNIYWRSQVFSIIRRPDGEKIYVRVCTYLALSLAFVAVLLSLFINPILKVMAGPSFHAAGEFVPWIVLVYLVRAIAANFRTVFLFEGKTGQEAQVTWVGAFACLLGYAGLIPPFRLWGAVAATGLAFFVMLLLGLWKAQRVRHFSFEYSRLAKIAVVAVSTVLVFHLLHPEALWLQLGLGAAFVCLYPAILCLLGFFHEDEKEAARGVLRMVMRSKTVYSARSVESS